MLWSHYADKHKGICFGFDVPDEMLVRVNYAGKKLVVDIEKLLDENALNEKTMLKIMTTKFEDWIYENEYRVFVNLGEKDRNTGLYFKDFGEDMLLREIILGARCKTGKGKIKTYIEGYKQKIEIINSRLAFRSFRIVPNLAKIN